VTAVIRPRPATGRDLAVLLRLARAFYDEDGFTTSDADLERNLLALLQSDDAHIAVAIRDDGDDDVVGFALTTARLILESGVVAELQDLYVTPSARTGGVGSALIADAVQWARTRSAGQLEIVIAPNGQDVSQLYAYYRGRGFVEEGRRLMVRDID
jgi:aminoglycoside 6'-N-acetyltransferase I